MRGSYGLGAIALCAVGCVGGSEEVTAGFADGGPVVEMVGAGVVSTSLPEFAATLTPEGDTIFFNRTPADRSRFDLYFAVRTGDEWVEPQLFAPTVGEGAIDPFLSLDGRRLYYSARHATSGQADPSFGLWYVDRGTGSWGPPTPLPPPINTDSSDTFNSFAGDGTMVFSSRRTGERRIYSARYIDGSWTNPALVTFGSSEAGSNPMISPDGTFVVISAPGPDGSFDLYVSCRVGVAWAEPHRLPSPISSEFADFAPGISGDYLYFTSERPGIVGLQPDSVRPPGDIYRTSLRPIASRCRPGLPNGR